MKTLELPRAVVSPATEQKIQPLLRRKLFLVFAAAVSFHLAFTFQGLSGFILLYAFCLIKLSECPPKTAFRAGFIVGFMVYAPHLSWFWNIFGFPAICLWAVLSFFSGAFVSTLAFWRKRFGSVPIILAGIVWTGFEYFRGELYPLKFSWLSAAHVFIMQPSLVPLKTFGLYGTGLLIFTAAALLLRIPAGRQIPSAIAASALLSFLGNLPLQSTLTAPESTVRVAGIQLEFPPELAVPGYLDEVIQQHPDTELLVLSEYAFDGPVPKRVRDWCDKNDRFLVAGGKDESIGGGEFYNTAFVIGPNGEVVFQQAKSVPIQFFQDGTPAPSRQIWNSPWGKLAIPICYDLSYRRVIDDFVRQGAQAIVVPFMDVEEWGEYQHRLHARNSSIRAAEYQIPIFRLGSSGISQHVNAKGEIADASSFPGREEIFAAVLSLPAKPNLPWDHWIAPLCSGLAGIILLILFVSTGTKERERT